jgi:hypothetical protein
MGIETGTNLFKIGNGTTAWNSLSYGGLQGPTGAMGTLSNVPSGSTGAPGLAFASDLSSGFYLPSTSNVGITTSGVERMRIGSNVTFSAPVSASTVSVSGTMNVTGVTSLQEVQEVVNAISGPSSTQTFDWLSGAVFYVTSMTANFTANITNLPTTANRLYIVTFILVQGSTPYFINALQIGGSAVTIRWNGAAAPTATANRSEFQTFALYYSGTTWFAFAQYSMYG